MDVFFIYICKQKKRSNNKSFCSARFDLYIFVLVAVINQEMHVMYDLQ